MEITKKEMKATFTKWCREWLENPDDFNDDDDYDTPEEYGEDAGNYFVEVLRRLRKKSKPSIQRSVKKGK